MKRRNKELWKRLAREAQPPDLSPSEETLDRIISHLQWPPRKQSAPGWEVFVWPILVRYALPGAVALVLCVAMMGNPGAQTPGAEELLGPVLSLP